MKSFPILLLFTAGPALFAAGPLKKDDPGTRTLHFVQDDAQDYMVSKIYILKYAQSNDITPFVTGMVKRYNMNSVVNCIEYPKAGNQQILTVTCPVGMMPYVDDFIEKVDRPVEIEGKVPGEIIRGTGITRAVYRPKYRSGQILVNLIVNAFINAGPYGSVYGWDKNSNQIYWKDNTSNTEFMYQFLEFLDRPAPQISITAVVYEVRESVLRDIGIDYLAWKNGPGLDLFQVGFRAFDLTSAGTAALQSMTGPMSGFFFAPQFDASFLRILEQNGDAKIRNTAHLTISNSDTATYEIYFNPALQNLVEEAQDRSAVGKSAVSAPADGGDEAVKQICLSVVKPVACLHSGPEVDFTIPAYKPGEYGGAEGTLFFGYDVQAVNAVERNPYGSELVETTQITGNATIRLNRENILAVWNRDQEVEQTIGVPYLSSIPILKYLFGTTTTSVEHTKLYLTVKAEILNTASGNEPAGVLTKLK